jgi:hypothetical protein
MESAIGCLLFLWALYDITPLTPEACTFATLVFIGVGTIIWAMQSTFDPVKIKNNTYTPINITTGWLYTRSFNLGVGDEVVCETPLFKIEINHLQ